MKIYNRQRGITLIALVVTIVVLLILAAASISMLTGENGIISNAQKSKEESEQARLEELVNLAIGSLIGQKNGDTSLITPQMIADEINRTENRTDVYPENNIFPTNIVFVEENKKVRADLNSNVSYDGIYNESGLEGKITPTDLFEFEIIDNTATGTNANGLPNKTARIKRIKPQYCNSGGYNPETQQNDLIDTHYEIIYEGNKITDTLVIPYEVEINGEMYRITEANLFVIASWDVGFTKGHCMTLPKIETIIYPNTIERIYNSLEFGIGDQNKTIKKVVLSNTLKEIGDYAFSGCVNLSNISIPNSVTKIGKNAFEHCDSLNTITIPNGITKISEYTFYSCTNLKNVKIPNGVTEIGKRAFSSCNSLNSIIIPSSVSYIYSNAFDLCYNLDTIIVIRNNNEEITGEPWGAYGANVTYIDIDSEYERFANDYVKNKNQNELEELLLKTNRFLGTFDEYLQEEVQMTRDEFEQMITENYGMSYLDALKFGLVYEMGENSWINVEYQVFLKGGSGKTVEELEELFLQKCIENGMNMEEIEQFLQQEGLTLRQFIQQIAEQDGFRTEEDFLKFYIYTI